MPFWRRFSSSTIVGLSLYLSPWWQKDHPQFDEAASRAASQLATWTTITIFVQLILGAAFRHGAFGIQPHMTGAGIVTIMVIWAARTVKHSFPGIREMRLRIVFLHATFGIQILLGVAAYWAVLRAGANFQPSATYVTLTVAHVLGGALLLAASLILTLSCFRLIRPSALVAVNSTGARLAGPTAS